ncbi:MAG: hypothetical protein ACRD3W_31305, partial [Terriglobales bacterium]
PIGAAIAVYLNLCSPEFAFAKELGLFRCLAVGGVLGCMLGTLIGAVVGSAVSEFTGNVSNKKLPGDRVLISVDVAGKMRRDTVRTIMRLCGAPAIQVRATDAAPHNDPVMLNPNKSMRRIS